MKRLYGLLIAIAALGVLVPLAAAGEHPVQRWDQKIKATSRFEVLSDFGGAAVLDHETGLVWEQSLSLSNSNWLDAQTHCNRLTTGGRLGWQLPTLQELTSLVDPSVPFPGPTLPIGHPFTNVQSFSYWSATTSAGNASFAWIVGFNGPVPAVFTADKIGIPIMASVWCVRGGHGVDLQ